MADYQIVSATMLHVGPLIARLGSQARRVEKAGLRSRRLLREYLHRSTDARTALMEGHPIAMWGFIGTALSVEVEPWLCLSDDARIHRFSVAREAMRHLRMALGDHPSLVATVAVGDERSARFARFLGFDVRDDVTLSAPIACHPIRMDR